jgi:hypothetical protein
MEIVVGLGRENHSSITTAIEKGLKQLNVKTDLQTKLSDPMNLISIVKKNHL